MQVLKRVSFKNLYKYLKDQLTKTPARNIAYFFGHGLFHVFLLLILIYLSFVWMNVAMTTKNPVYHHININLHTKDWQTKMQWFDISVMINNDSIFKKHGFHSSVEVSYTPESLSDTNIIKFSRMPYTFPVNIDTLLHIESYNLIKNDTVLEIATPTYPMILPSGKAIPGKQTLAFCSNDIFSEPDNPYHYVEFFLDIDCDWDSIPPYSGLFFTFGEPLRLYPAEACYNQPISIKYIYPEPTNIRGGMIAYYGEDLKKLFTQPVVMELENIELKNKEDRRGFRDSVLLGTLVGFILTVLVEIFAKWKHLNDRQGKKESL